MLELLPYSEFAKLRLRDYCDNVIEARDSPFWEWMDGIWYIDGIRFTWFGCLDQMPGETGCMEIFFEEISKSAAKTILSKVGLPLKAGDDLKRISELLGPPINSHRFVDDRITYYYLVGESCPYTIGCTIHQTDGLIFLSVLRQDVYERIKQLGEG